MAQSYESHVHHPVPVYAAVVLWLAALVCLTGWSWFGWGTFTAGVFLLAFSVLPLIGISRVYTTRLQDRIILLEMKMRCRDVLPAGEGEKLSALGLKQVVALRFAPDRELGSLLERSVREHLSPDEIKKAITEWRPDHLRT